MKVIQVMFDTLKRNYLSPYDTSDVLTPNFTRLATKTVRFDNFFAGSLPCMPARRDMQTGRYNFLHRGWGPLEPFDDSMPELLKNNGIYTHLVTDHKHYWRDGGSTYHPRYSSYELIRGQEGDNWKPKVNKNTNIDGLEKLDSEGQKRKMVSMSQDAINRSHMPNEEDHPLFRTVEAGLEFLRENQDADNWFLQIESFDPHEPFFVPEKYLEMYGVSQEDYNGWLLYSYDDYSDEHRRIVQGYYKALVTMCDAYLGKVLDYMDEKDLWHDTMLIVNTDHGFMLGEHEWWGKNIMPVYNEIAQLPFFIWNPSIRRQNDSTDELAQTIDIPATILDFFNIEIPKDMKGKSLSNVLEHDQANHNGLLFGYFGSNINITNGEYVYMRAPMPNVEHLLHEYTLSPMRINRRFTIDELQGATLTEPFDFTKGLNVLKIKSNDIMAKNYQRFGHKLFNYKQDPNQEHPIDDISIEYDMIVQLKELMKDHDAPEELYAYYGLDKIHSEEDVRREHEQTKKRNEALLHDIKFEESSVKEGYLTLQTTVNDANLIESLQQYLQEASKENPVTKTQLRTWVKEKIPAEKQSFISYQLNLSMRVH